MGTLLSVLALDIGRVKGSMVIPPVLTLKEMSRAAAVDFDRKRVLADVFSRISACESLIVTKAGTC